MEFGQALFWTLQVASNNIAYKGIAIRVDPGAGGVTGGRAWILYDHDTLRVAAAWTGHEFVDWKGIAFDGSHQTHTSIRGTPAFVNPVGPGWAKPGTAQFEDPRAHGRDGKPYGPLPREWAHYQGTYLHGDRVVLAYTVGDARVLESPSLENDRFVRTLNIGRATSDLLLRVAPDSTGVTLAGSTPAILEQANGFHQVRIAAAATPLRFKLLLGRGGPRASPAAERQAEDLEPFTRGGPARWTQPVVTQPVLGSDTGPFAVDDLTAPRLVANPWHSWMRFGGFDFFPDGLRAAICTWNGDVWLVDGLEGNLSELRWKRIASGLFQPLGVKVVDGRIYLTCRDQIARLQDLNGDGEIDFIENFNNDHQVTEHFHEFAMGLQTDAQGNFYYAKSARHALPALVPHHGTLLRVSADGLRTEIVANGFRAANGVCVNDDGTFFVTDQEGHWTPKNRINWVRPGRFYGNLYGYHEQTSEADADMEQPLVWITNEMDRSPGELLWVTSKRWGALRGSLLNLSYGTGRIFLVPHETVRGQKQGGVVRLPIPELPTGVMRGRFHPDGSLFACGLFGWAGNRTVDGGFYRIRPTGQPLGLPVQLHATAHGVRLGFTEALDPASAGDAENYSVKVWSLKRSKDYGSKHIDEHTLRVTRASLASDPKQVLLEIPELAPTWCMEIRYSLRLADGTPVRDRIHNTVHQLPEK